MASPSEFVVAKPGGRAGAVMLATWSWWRRSRPSSASSSLRDASNDGLQSGQDTQSGRCRGLIAPARKGPKRNPLTVLNSMRSQVRPHQLTIHH